MKLLFLDFDDCVINWNLRESDFILNELKFNLSCIRDFCIDKGYKIVIISSWAKLFKSNSLELKDKFKGLDKLELDIVNTLKEYIKDLVALTDTYNDRVRFIKELAKENEKDIHIVLDDSPLPELVGIKNVIYLQIINGMMYEYKGKMVGNLLKLGKYFESRF